MKLKSFCLEFTTVIQINLLSDMATLVEDVFTVYSPADLEAEMCRYNCHTKEELEEVLRNDYGVVLILDYEEDNA